MSFYAKIGKGVYPAKHPSVIAFARQGAEMTCPECEEGLSYHREAFRKRNGQVFKVSPYFATAQNKSHKKGCSHQSVKSEKQPELRSEAIKVFNKNFSDDGIYISYEEYQRRKNNTSEAPIVKTIAKKEMVFRISSLKKFVEYLEEAQFNEEKRNKKFEYKGSEYSFDKIYFQKNNFANLYREVQKTNSYEIENSMVFAKIKIDANMPIHRASNKRSTYNPNGNYVVYCESFTFKKEDGNIVSIRPRINFGKDATLMEKFLKIDDIHNSRVIWAVPLMSSKESYIDFNIYSENQFEALSQPRQAILFKIPPKQERDQTAFHSLSPH